jgi:hypothetical protein
MLSTTAGRFLFPETSAHIGISDHLRQLAKNTRTALAKVGKHMHQALGFFLVGGLPTRAAADVLNTTEPQIRLLQKEPSHAAIRSLGLDYDPKAKNKDFTKAEERVMEDFFFKTTSVMSGATRDTRNLEMTQHEWEEEMYALWPLMLRSAVQLDPELLAHKKPLTKKKQELGLPHGIAVLCVVVHEIMGPSSVYIHLVSSTTNCTFHTSGLTVFQASCRAASMYPSPLARSLAVCVCRANSFSRINIISMLCRCN